MDIIRRDNYWIETLQAFLNFTLIMDMIDDKKYPYSERLPAAISQINRCQFLRYEAKLNCKQIEEGAAQLIESFFPGAFDAFPRGSNSIVGVVSTDEVINIYLMEADDIRQDEHNR